MMDDGGYQLIVVDYPSLSMPTGPRGPPDHEGPRHIVAQLRQVELCGDEAAPWPLGGQV